MEQNNAVQRRRLEAVNESLKLEQQKAMRHKQALQLLNLWCGRKEFFPGLRLNAAELRYEPNRSLDDLLSNPLAIEYLKVHCDNDRTLENLWFLLDVSWLSELETAEDGEEDAEKRKKIRAVCVATAETILARYIAVDAPQQINVSAGCFEALRGKGKSYQRGMFKDAVGEVKLMLDTDILPRFQKTTVYTAMSENIFVDSFAEADESGFSSETVSTAGSVLEDSDTGDAGVNNMFAFNFKNLYGAFDAASEADASTFTDASLLVDGPVVTSSGSDGQIKTESTGAGVASSSDKKTVDSSHGDSSSVRGSEMSEKKKSAAVQKTTLGSKKDLAKSVEISTSTESSSYSESGESN